MVAAIVHHLSTSFVVLLTNVTDGFVRSFAALITSRRTRTTHYSRLIDLLALCGSDVTLCYDVTPSMADRLDSDRVKAISIGINGHLEG